MVRMDAAWKIIWPGRLRWIVKSIEWLRPTWNCGSFWKLRISLNPLAGTIGDGTALGAGGVGIGPSTPTRKLAKPGLAPAPDNVTLASQPSTLVPSTLPTLLFFLLLCAYPTPN